MGDNVLPFKRPPAAVRHKGNTLCRNGHHKWQVWQRKQFDVKAGKLVGIHLRPHDLRRHAATYASRSGVPLEIVSKIILRHSNLSTTQIYLGRISDSEALKWIETIYD